MDNNTLKTAKNSKLQSQQDNTNNAATATATRGKDRLSSLPDFLLGNILSRLPLDSAAATSVLSHRWRGLWARFRTSVILDCHCFPPSTTTFSRCSGSTRGFLTIIDHILRQFNSRQIFHFNLCIMYPWENDERELCSQLLQSWLQLFCRRNLREIKVKLDSNSFGYQGPLIPVPTIIFQCSSLIVLELKGNFDCKLPENQVIALPNLKKFDIKLPAFNNGFIGTLITLLKYCPLLEILILALEFLVDEFVVYICAPNLKTFRASMSGTSHRSRFLIDAPRLIRVTIDGMLAFYSFVHQQGTLQVANIGFHSYIFKSESDYLSSIFELIGGISSIRFLGLLDNLALFNIFNHMNANAFWPIFHNLTKLSLESPSRDYVNERAPIPTCVLKKLKWVEITGIDGDDSDIEFLKYILQHADVLKDLIISIDVNIGVNEGEDSERDQLWMEYKCCRALFDFPKRSLICEIVFYGCYITEASSKDLKDSLLASKISYFK